MLKPTNKEAPAEINTDAANTSSCKPKELYKIEPTAIPIPIPISNNATFKMNTLAKEFGPFLPNANILASAPFSINAKRSLFLVEKNK